MAASSTRRSGALSAWLALALISSACINFDEELNRARARLADGGAAGGAGGMGGGSAGSGGGMSGAGGAGGGTSGCTDLLCLVAVHSTPQLRELSGVLASSSLVVAGGSQYDAGAAPERYSSDSLARPLPDGGLDVTPIPGALSSTEGLYPLVGTPTNAWATNGGQIFHFRENGTSLVALDWVTCGITRPRGFWALVPQSPSSVLAISTNFGVCLINDEGFSATLTKVQDHSETHSAGANYVYGMYQTDAGERLVVAASGRVHDFDGGALSEVLDSYPDFGLVDIDGSGERIFVIGRSGVIGERQADGGFAEVFVADGPLFDLEVVSPTEAWAVGDGTLMYGFDGQRWRKVAIPAPGITARTRIRAIAVAGRKLYLAGAESTLRDSALLISLERGAGAWP